MTRIRSFSTPILLALISCSVLFAQEENGRLYNPPAVELRGWMDMIVRVGRRYDGKVGWVWGENSTNPIVLKRTHYPITDIDLLPVLFFERGSTQIPDRYLRYSTPQLVDDGIDTVPVLYEQGGVDSPGIGETKRAQLLDIIGSRMLRYPRSTLFIEGGFSGESTESAEVADLRAEAVRDYLTAFRGIDPARLHILSSRQVCGATAPYTHQLEARRVVLSSDEPSLLDPVRCIGVSTLDHLLHLEMTIDPRWPRSNIRDLRLLVSIGDVQVLNETLSVEESANVLRFRGVIPIVWAIENFARLPDPVRAQVVVTLNDGRRFSSGEKQLPFRESITLVHYDDSTVTGDDATLLTSWQPLLFAVGDSSIAGVIPSSLYNVRHLLDSVQAIVQAHHGVVCDTASIDITGAVAPKFVLFLRPVSLADGSEIDNPWTGEEFTQFIGQVNAATRVWTRRNQILRNRSFPPQMVLIHDALEKEIDPPEGMVSLLQPERERRRSLIDSCWMQWLGFDMAAERVAGLERYLQAIDERYPAYFDKELNQAHMEAVHALYYARLCALRSWILEQRLLDTAIVDVQIDTSNIARQGVWNIQTPEERMAYRRVAFTLIQPSLEMVELDTDSPH